MSTDPWPSTIKPRSNHNAALPPLDDWVILFHVEHPENDYVRQHPWINAQLTPSQSSPAKRASQLLLRQLLASYLHIAPQDLSFCYTDKGKPYIVDRPLFFNLSDTRDALFIALDKRGAIGLDIEPIQRPFCHNALVQRHFSTEDQEIYNRLDNDENRRLWALYGWTRKEALGKAMGVGIRYPMSKTSVMVDFPNEIPITINQQTFALQSYKIPHYDVIASLAMTDQSHPVQLFHIGKEQWQKTMQ